MRSQVGAYQQAVKQNLTGRALEAAVLMRITTALEDGIRAENRDAVDEALHRNKLFWSFVQASLVDPTNALPDDLTANLMSLSIFIDRQMVEWHQNHSDRHITNICNINRNISAGLSQ